MLFTLSFMASVFLSGVFYCVSLNSVLMLCDYFVFFLQFFRLSSASSHFLSLCFLTTSFLSSCNSNYVSDFIGRNNFLNKIFFKKNWNANTVFIYAAVTVFWWVFLFAILFFYAFFEYTIMLSLHVFCMVPLMIHYWRSYVPLTILLSAD